MIILKTWDWFKSWIARITLVVRYLYFIFFVLGSVHLASQDYSNCIRAEQSYCSIQYTACDTTSFQMTGTAATSAWGDDCNTDYVHIQGLLEKLFEKSHLKRKPNLWFEKSHLHL